jgi:hypothetical protein
VIDGAITATRTGLLIPFYGDGIGLTTQSAISAVSVCSLTSRVRSVT